MNTKAINRLIERLHDLPDREFAMRQPKMCVLGTYLRGNLTDIPPNELLEHTAARIFEIPVVEAFKLVYAGDTPLSDDVNYKGSSKLANGDSAWNAKPIDAIRMLEHLKASGEVRWDV